MDLVPNSGLWPVQEAFLQSLVWRDPKAFPPDILRHVRATAKPVGDERIFETLLQIACVPGHPLNADYIHQLLWRLSLSERDGWWSVFLHWTGSGGDAVARLLDWAGSDDTSYCSDDAALFCATIISWFLSSSNRLLRDRATKSLVNLLKHRLAVLTRLLERFDRVNDPYVAERLYAVAHGCCLITGDAQAVEEVAQTVYRQVFADGRPPVHILVRDYARGVIERAINLGCPLSDVEISRCRPPYWSPWPLSAPSRQAMEQRYEKVGGFASLLHSTNDWGDFARYVVETAVRHFIAPNQKRRLSAIRLEAKDRANERWGRFIQALGERQGVVSEALAQGGDLMGILSEQEKVEIASVLREYRAARSISGPVFFDHRVASRWILSKVMRLGWTPNRFGQFDQMVQLGADRRGHRLERIGKKYQWIALHGLLASLADHCKVGQRWGGSTPAPYEGPWDFGIRDIDPSLLLRSTQTVHDHLSECWWSPVNFPIAGFTDPDTRKAWVQDGDNLPPPARLIDVRDSSGTRWLALEGHYQWDEESSPESDPLREGCSWLWYQIRGYLVGVSQADAFCEWAKDKNWMGRWMPESTTLHEAFLGEYPWHPAAANDRSSDWKELGDHSVPTSVMVTAAEYACEGNGFDCSIEESVRGLLPSPTLTEVLGLRWTGDNFDFADGSGRVVAQDPSAEVKGPQALLLEYGTLSAYLEREHLTVVWTVLGEKLALGHTRPVDGRLDVYGAFVLADGVVQEISMNSSPLDG